MKDFIDVTLLAVLQGVAEFLPISSSGHLVILQHILDVPEHLRLRLEIFLHAGTLLSIFAFYARSIWTILSGLIKGRSSAWVFTGKIILSAVPAIVVYMLFHDQIESLIKNARLVGGLLMFTGVVLWSTRYLSSGQNNVGVGHALAMGFAQAFALLPGVSRSGMTLAMARGCQVSPESAAQFSFLMSAPLILGGTLLELVKMIKDQTAAASGSDLSVGVLIWGTLLAAVVGYFSLVFLVKTLKGRWFWLFGPYCLLAGLLTFCFCK